MLLLWEIYEKASNTLILLCVFAVIYIIGVVGYFKMIMRSAEIQMVREEGLVIFFTLMASIIWPVLTFWSLLVEASK